MRLNSWIKEFERPRRLVLAFGGAARLLECLIGDFRRAFEANVARALRPTDPREAPHAFTWKSGPAPALRIFKNGFGQKLLLGKLGPAGGHKGQMMKPEPCEHPP